MRVDSSNEGVLTRFLWMNGGRHVSLSGSFVKWNYLIPMTSIEGSTSVFQAVYPIVPGQHEYKFCVDGVWQHDEQQPYISGCYGVVNTIFVPKEAGGIASGCNAEMTDRSNMEVDDVKRTNEVIPRISESNLEVSRRLVALFLSTHAAYEILPDSGKVISLDVGLPVKEAFHILHEEGLPMAPLWDTDRFVGVLSSLDFILMLRELGRRGSNMIEEVLSHYTISTWKEEKVHIIKQIDGSKSYPRRFVQAGPHDSLKDITLKILQNNVATVPIIHCSNKVDLSLELLHMASLSEILKCICRYFRFSSSSLPILHQPICSIPLGTWVVKTNESGQRQFAALSSDATLGAALQLLVKAGVSSIPIVNKINSLLNIYARSDIIALAKNKAYTQIQLEETSIQQALQLGQEASSPNMLYSQRYRMCLRTDPLHKIMECLAKPGVRRIVIVEAGSRHVEGIISLSDIFKFLLG